MEQQQSEDKNPFDILKHFHSQVRIAEHASDADTGLTKMYLEGVEEENLEKIYHFVHSVEIGCGFTPNPMLDNAFSDAYNQDAEKAFHTIDSRHLSVVEAICLLSCMSVEQIIYYVDTLAPQNSVLLFESIRHLLKNANYMHQYPLAIANGIAQLSEIDDRRFMFLLKKHEHSKNWFVVG